MNAGLPEWTQRKRRPRAWITLPLHAIWRPPAKTPKPSRWLPAGNAAPTASGGMRSWTAKLPLAKSSIAKKSLARQFIRRTFRTYTTAKNCSLLIQVSRVCLLFSRVFLRATWDITTATALFYPSTIRGTFQGRIRSVSRKLKIRRSTRSTMRSATLPSSWMTLSKA